MKYFVIFFMSFMLFSCAKKHKTKEAAPFWIKTITCDFESLSSQGGSQKYKTDSVGFDVFTGEGVKTAIGRFESKAIDIDSNLIDLCEINKLKKGQLVELSIWQKEGGSMASLIAKENNGKVFESSTEQLGKAKKGWKQHFISIPIHENEEKIEVYLKGTGRHSIFDDFNIKIYPIMPKNQLKSTLKLYIPNNSKRKLNNYIDQALGKKIIPASSKKYVKAFMINQGDTAKIKMKIKGDWTDHIQPDKASFRIKGGKNNAYHGMRTFSIQHPKTRNYLNEWLIHKIAENQDVLTTTYDFVNVTINNYNYGVYAIEEHFDKHIVENRKRREGPILKFDESGTWLFRAENENPEKQLELPIFEASSIEVFKENRTLNNPMLFKEFEEAKKLLKLFKEGSLSVDDIFDIDQLARYYALIELCGNYHALTWHNRRFYYNPITQKLEHILYDANLLMNSQRRIMHEILTNTHKERNLILDNAVIMNKEFKDKYLYYIDKYTEPAFLDSIFGSLENEISIFYPALKNEKPAYQFSKQEFYNRARFIREGIPALTDEWNKTLMQAKNIDYWMNKEDYPAIQDDSFYLDFSVNAYREQLEDGKYKITLKNFHMDEVVVDAYLIGKEKKEIPLEQAIKLPKYTKQSTTSEIIVDSLPRGIVFSVKNVPNKRFRKDVFPWSYPAGISSRMVLKQLFNPEAEWYSIEGDKLVFNHSVVIDQLLYIPSNYLVEIKPGTLVEFKNGGGLIVNNNFICRGTKDKKIVFICKDETSKGVTILNGGKVEIENTTMDGLSNLDYKSWVLTGALTIYETPCSITNLEVKNNHCEDALNIVRSNFEINGLSISNTYSDGFDADFCTGTLTDSEFRDTGNDCIDFSGSEVNMTNIKINNSGDKGISGGEGSHLTISDIIIDGSITGIASKDASRIKGVKIEIKNTQTGVTAFQKKATYGPAFIDLSECVFENTTEEIKVEKYSEIIVNNVKHEGTERFDIEEIYSIFSKK